MSCVTRGRVQQRRGLGGIPSERRPFGSASDSPEGLRKRGGPQLSGPRVGAAHDCHGLPLKGGGPTRFFRSWMKFFVCLTEISLSIEAIIVMIKKRDILCDQGHIHNKNTNTRTKFVARSEHTSPVWAVRTQFSRVSIFKVFNSYSVRAPFLKKGIMGPVHGEIILQKCPFEVLALDLRRQAALANCSQMIFSWKNLYVLILADAYANYCTAN